MTTIWVELKYQVNGNAHVKYLTPKIVLEYSLKNSMYLITLQD